MSIFRDFQRSFATRAASQSSGWHTVSALSGSKGGQVDIEAASGLPAFWFCATLIADAISTLPVDFFRKNEDGRKEIGTPDWAISPNDFQTWDNLMQSFGTSLLLKGDGFLYMMPVPNARGYNLYALDPDDVEIEAVGIDVVYKFQGTPVNKDDLVHVMHGIILPGMTRPVGLLEAAAQAIRLGISAQKFGQDFIDNGLSLSAVVEVPKSSDILEEEARKIAENLQTRHSGGKNKLAFLTGGATLKTLSISPEQAQLMETRDYNKTDIALYCRIPPYMVNPNVQSSWGTGVAEQNFMFHQMTLRPMLVRIENAITAKFLKGNGYMKFNVSAYTRGREVEQVEIITKGIAGGTLTPNEGRALFDRPPVEGGDEILMPLNIAPLSHQERKLRLQEAKGLLEQDITKEANEPTNESD